MTSTLQGHFTKFLGYFLEVSEVYWRLLGGIVLSVELCNGVGSLTLDPKGVVVGPFLRG